MPGGRMASAPFLRPVLIKRKEVADYAERNRRQRWLWNRYSCYH